MDQIQAQELRNILQDTAEKLKLRKMKPNNKLQAFSH
jgi:hypothetical protein